MRKHYGASALNLTRLNRRAVHGSDSDETEHQVALIFWARETEALQTDPVKREALHWLHAIPNHAGRSGPRLGRRGLLPPLEAVALKAQGVVAGIWDLRLDYEATHESIYPDYPDTHKGLIIEMKSAKGQLSVEQRRYESFMSSQGFDCRVYRTWQGAARAIVHYMDLFKFGPVFVELERGHITTITDRASLLAMELEG